MSDGFITAVQLSTALHAYANKAKTGTTTDVDTLIQRSKLREGSFDKMFPAMFSLHGLDIREALDRAVINKDITKNAADLAVIAFSRAMEAIGTGYPVLDTGTFNKISECIQNIITEFNSNGINTLNNDKLARMDVHVNALKRLFDKPYIVAYSAGNDTRLPSVKIAHNSFSNLRTIVNNKIKQQIETVLKENKVTNSKLTDPTFLTTKIINWGHTQAGGSILSGKLLAETIAARKLFSSIGNSSDIIKVVVKDFLEETGQAKTVIKLHQGDLTKGDPNVLSLVLESGIFQSVIVQNRRENQEDLGQLEKAWSIISAIERGGLLKAFGVQSVQGLVSKLLKVRSSPSMEEKIVNRVASALLGTKPEPTKKTIPLLDNTQKIIKPRKQVKVLNNTTRDLKVDPPRTGSISGEESLVGLLALINEILPRQIKSNMGEGSSTTTLNYRTGRFAESAKVERLSVSRQGMITAFYTYMKNPYATFSVGGAQSMPTSRDPKLLISKSIREIAANRVANRMRAVLV